MKTFFGIFFTTLLLISAILALGAAFVFLDTALGIGLVPKIEALSGWQGSGDLGKHSKEGFGLFFRLLGVLAIGGIAHAFSRF